MNAFQFENQFEIRRIEKIFEFHFQKKRLLIIFAIHRVKQKKHKQKTQESVFQIQIRRFDYVLKKHSIQIYIKFWTKLFRVFFNRYSYLAVDKYTLNRLDFRSLLIFNKKVFFLNNVIMKYFLYKQCNDRKINFKNFLSNFFCYIVWRVLMFFAISNQLSKISNFW